MGRLNRTSVEDRAAGRFAGLSLGAYLAQRRYSCRLMRDYLIPAGAAIWSTPIDQMLAFPAEKLRCLLRQSPAAAPRLPK